MHDLRGEALGEAFEAHTTAAESPPPRRRLAAAATSAAVTASGTAIIIVQFQASRSAWSASMLGASVSAHHRPSSGATLKSRSGAAFFSANLSV